MKRVLIPLLLFIAVAACGKETVREVVVRDTTTTTVASSPPENYGPTDQRWCDLYSEYLDTPAESAAEDASINAIIDYEDANEFGPVLQALIDSFYDAVTDEASNAATDGQDAFCFEPEVSN